MRIRNTRCLGVFLLGLTPTLALGQVAPESRDRPRDAQGWPTEAVRATHGMVATDEELGSQAGVEILKRGGNAVDAGVAGGVVLGPGVAPGGETLGGGVLLVGGPARGKSRTLLISGKEHTTNPPPTHLQHRS